MIEKKQRRTEGPLILFALCDQFPDFCLAVAKYRCLNNDASSGIDTVVLLSQALGKVRVALRV